RIGYSDTQGIAPANFPLRFNAGELLLQIAGNDSAQENLRKATVTLTYHSLERSIERLPKWLIATPKFALALTALIALGWFLATNFHRQVPASPASPASFTEEKAALQPISTPTPPEIAQTTAHLATYRLVPDELATRGSGTGTGEIPLILVPTHPSLVQLELPIASADATRSFHCTLKTFSKDQAILTARRLKAIRSASGNLIVTFSVPSTVLKANTDYSVDLRSNGPHGKLEELSTYTFHAARKTE
ncbi:MAG TPA: hypothetical protein VKU42_00565, partial [Candidatus Angelobacter sp.]|nr:hypothetical protein [Candidatus Angelobacter sp.]